MKQYKDTPYYVSTDGNIYREGKTTPLKPDVGKYGYRRVTLSINGKTLRDLVHRIVAEIYLPNPDNKPQVNHIDNDRGNNAVSNLEWCTISENALHGVKQGNWANLIASRKVSESKFKESEQKFKNLLGNNFIRLENRNPRNYVIYTCSGCDREMHSRTDSSAFNAPPYVCRYCSIKMKI